MNTGTYFRTIHQQTLTPSRQEVFTSYIDKLLEYNENLDQPSHWFSFLESLQEKQYYFEGQNLQTKFTRPENPQYWLQQDILPITQFQCNFFQNIILHNEKHAGNELAGSC